MSSVTRLRGKQRFRCWPSQIQPTLAVSRHSRHRVQLLRHSKQIIIYKWEDETRPEEVLCIFIVALPLLHLLVMLLELGPPEQPSHERDGAHAAHDPGKENADRLANVVLGVEDYGSHGAIELQGVEESQHEFCSSRRWQFGGQAVPAATGTARPPEARIGHIPGRRPMQVDI